MADNPLARSQSTSDARFEATAAALESITDAATDHSADPKQTVHAPANHDHSHKWLQKIFPQSSLETWESKMHMGNYVIDRPTGAKTFEPMSIYVRVGMHALYYGSEQEKALHWKRTLDLLERQSRKMGAEYDKPESTAHIPPFIQSFQLQPGLAELKQPDPSKYPTFNAFFARELKESARPVEQANDPKVVSSPADCRLSAFETVDQATKYWIKGYGFTLAKLLGSAELAQQFDGGSMVIARLAPQDYHRWHAPVAGKVASIQEIPGAYYTVNPQAINEPGTLDVFCENRRSVMTVQRSGTGSPVAIVAVGAMLVGSIKYNPGIDVGAEFQRGQCLGAFYYGGSTVIIVYPRGEVTLDKDLVKNSTEQGCETLMKVGWRTGAGPV
ncbi:MAG: hypothetical protein M1821_005565 [Bathelium mastoideum]|nr:MAG: hypothetical protein M1821_005565 [Bathelium mastoideum]